MKTVAIFKNGGNRAVRLPKGFDFPGVNELEIIKEGSSLILRPCRPTWTSLASEGKADPDFMINREDIVLDEGRFSFD